MAAFSIKKRTFVAKVANYGKGTIFNKGKAADKPQGAATL